MENDQIYSGSTLVDDSLENMGVRDSVNLSKLESNNHEDDYRKSDKSSIEKFPSNHSKTSNWNTLGPHNREVKHNSYKNSILEKNCSKVKTVIDETFYNEYKEKLIELETIKYEHEILRDNNHIAIQRINFLEKENKIIATKYQKLKDMYRALKDQHRNLRYVEIEKSELSQMMQDLKDQLQTTPNEEKKMEQVILNLQSNFEKLTAEMNEKTQSLLDLEFIFRIEKENLEKEKNEIAKKSKDTQTKLENEIEELIKHNDRIKRENNIAKETIIENQDKNFELLEINKRLKEELLKHKEIIQSLQTTKENLEPTHQDLKKLKSSEKICSITEKGTYEAFNSTNLVSKQTSNVSRKGSFEETVALLKEKNEEEHSKDKQKISLLNSEVERLTEGQESLKKTIDSIQEEYLDKKKMFQEEEDLYKKEIKILNDKLQYEHQSYQKEIENLNSKITELNNEKCDLLNENDREKLNFGYLEFQMTKFQNTIYHLETQNEKLQNELEKLTNLNLSYLENNQNYIKEIQNKDQEIQSLKIRENEHLSTIKQLEIMPPEVQHKTENEQKNHLTYSNSFSENSIRSDLRSFKNVHPIIQNVQISDQQEDETLILKNVNYQDEHIESNDVSHDKNGINLSNDSEVNEFITRDLFIKPSFLSVNYEVQKLSDKYNEIKSKFQQNLQNRK